MTRMQAVDELDAAEHTLARRDQELANAEDACHVAGAEYSIAFRLRNSAAELVDRRRRSLIADLTESALTRGTSLSQEVPDPTSATGDN
jgi:hypothetical protein